MKAATTMCGNAETCSIACRSSEHHLSTLGSVLHDVTQNTVACAANSKALKHKEEVREGQSKGNEVVRVV